MAIQHRRGPERLFDPARVIDAEISVALDTRKVFMCFAPGDAEELVKISQLEQAKSDLVSDAKRYSELSEQSANQSKYYSENSNRHSLNAETSANNSLNYSILSKSWAIGDTGTREGEDTDNSKYYSQQSSSYVTQAKTQADRAESYMQSIEDALTEDLPTFSVNFLTGNLDYTGAKFEFIINMITGNLEWSLA